jgi:hypothetical protein
LTDSFKIQFKNPSAFNHKKTSCIKVSCLFACSLIIQEVKFSGSLFRNGGSSVRKEWLKTMHMWLNSSAIIKYQEA